MCAKGPLRKSVEEVLFCNYRQLHCVFLGERLVCKRVVDSMGSGCREQKNVPMSAHGGKGEYCAEGKGCLKNLS